MKCDVVCWYSEAKWNTVSVIILPPHELAVLSFCCILWELNNRAKPLTLNSQLILLPSLGNEENLWFDGWYTDISCTKSLTNFEITSDTSLYGKWEENNNNYTITFDTRGGSPVGPITEQFESTVAL